MGKYRDRTPRARKQPSSMVDGSIHENPARGSTIGEGGETTISSPGRPPKQPLPGTGLHDPLHGRQACPTSHSTRRLVKYVPSRGYIRAVSSQNGNKLVTSPPPPIVERVQPRPRICLPLEVESNKPRLIWDARYLNSMCKHPPFSDGRSRERRTMLLERGTTSHIGP